jgi:hypothetical protein
MGLSVNVKLIEVPDLEIPLPKFVAAWQTLVLQHGDRTKPLTQSILVGNEGIRFEKLVVAKGRGGSLDALCRCLAPVEYIDRMMATARMLDANALFLEKDEGARPQTVHLTELAWTEWNELGFAKQNKLLRRALKVIKPTLLS